MNEQNSPEHALALRHLGWNVRAQVLALKSFVKGFDLRGTSHGFEIVRRGKCVVVATIAHEGLQLTTDTQPDKCATVTDAIVAWDFIDTHLRSLVPRALFEGEEEQSQLMA